VFPEPEKARVLSDIEPRFVGRSGCTGVLISHKPDQEGNKLMFLSEWREFPSVSCLARKKTLDDSSRLDVVEIARVTVMLPSLFPSSSG